jgi:uncharacterized lipoprotein NlpE involved in copper resistance
MKKSLFLLTVLICLSFIGCKNKTEQKEATELKEKITVAYFHGERRCETCIAVGNIAKLTVEENYKDNKDVAFKDINIDLDENEALAEKYEIAGSALLIIVDGKAEDITGFAFKNALTQQELLKDKIKGIVNKSL